MKTTLPLISEYLGTFLLVLSMLSLNNVLFIGIVYTMIIFLTYNVSGAAINPVIALVYFIKGRLSNMELLQYIFVETVAGVTAFYTFNFIK